jgi:lysophospholipase L1-like esterase
VGRRRSVAAAAARAAGAGVAAGLLLAGCSATHTSAAPKPTPTPTPTRKPTPTSTPRGPYVALGDSYTSGPDIPNQTGSPAGCDRSDRNYPALLAARLKLGASRIHDVSCSGATIADLTTPQTTDNGTNPPQLGALTADTALVTVGIGGNDLDFSGVLTRCVELDAPGTILGLLRHSSTDSAPCRAYYTSGGADQIEQKIQTSATELAAALALIHRLAPHARVLVVGYPDMLPATDGAACAHTLGISAGDVAYLDTEELALNSMLRQQAAAAHDTYVDTYSPSLGHDACSDSATRWIEPLLPDAAAAPLHPNSLGEQGLADAVEHALRS